MHQLLAYLGIEKLQNFLQGHLSLINSSKTPQKTSYHGLIIIMFSFYEYMSGCFQSLIHPLKIVIYFHLHTMGMEVIYIFMIVVRLDNPTCQRISTFYINLFSSVLSSTWDS